MELYTREVRFGLNRCRFTTLLFYQKYLSLIRMRLLNLTKSQALINLFQFVKFKIQIRKCAFFGIKLLFRCIRKTISDTDSCSSYIVIVVKTSSFMTLILQTRIMLMNLREYVCMYVLFTVEKTKTNYKITKQLFWIVHFTRILISSFYYI